MELSDLVGCNDKDCLVVIGNVANVDNEIKKKKEKMGLSNVLPCGVEILDGDNRCEMNKGNLRSLVDEQEICVVKVDKKIEDGKDIESNSSREFGDNNGVVFVENSSKESGNDKCFKQEKVYRCMDRLDKKSVKKNENEVLDMRCDDWQEKWFAYCGDCQVEKYDGQGDSLKDIDKWAEHAVGDVWMNGSITRGNRRVYGIRNESVTNHVLLNNIRSLSDEDERNIFVVEDRNGIVFVHGYDVYDQRSRWPYALVKKKYIDVGSITSGRGNTIKTSDLVDYSLLLH